MAQLYTDDGFLIRAVTQFAGDGLAAGEGVVIIGTPEHSSAIAERLATAFEVSAARARNQLVVLDAELYLQRFMVDGTPDRTKFLELVDAVLDRIRQSGFESIRLFGEMVNILCSSNPAAAEALEVLWDEVLSAHQLPLLCAYRLDVFDPHVHRGLLQSISRRHSHLVPVEDYARLESAVARAYGEVFGRHDDTARLRELLASRVAPPPVMPAGQRALVAARSVGGDIADDVLQRARAHYAEPVAS